MQITQKSKVTDAEIGELRAAVGWGHEVGTYDRVLKGVHTYFTARDERKLIGFVSVISDSVADAFLVDLMVHPDFQRQGLGKSLVREAIKYAKSIGVQCVHVTYDRDLEDFYRNCGFHIIGGGIIDFRNTTMS